MKRSGRQGTGTSGKAKLRACTGSGILMSVSGVSLITAILVGGTALITHIGTATYYHDKLEFIARQGATHAAAELSWAGAPRDGAKPGVAVQKATDTVKEMLAGMGLPAPSSVDVDIEDTGVSVTVTVSGLAMPAGTILPTFLELEARAQKLFEEDRPPAIVLLRCGADPKDTTVAVPALAITGKDFRLPQQPAPHPTRSVGMTAIGSAEPKNLCAK